MEGTDVLFILLYTSFSSMWVMMPSWEIHYIQITNLFKQAFNALLTLCFSVVAIEIFQH